MQINIRRDVKYNIGDLVMLSTIDLRTTGRAKKLLVKIYWSI